MEFTLLKLTLSDFTAGGPFPPLVYGRKHMEGVGLSVKRVNTLLGVVLGINPRLKGCLGLKEGTPLEFAVLGPLLGSLWS